MAYRIRHRRGTGALHRPSLKSYRRLGIFNMVQGALKGHWQDLLDGAWFIPALVALLGLGLAILLVTIDSITDPVFFLGFHGSASTARTLLSTVTGGILTIVGLVISVTIVSLQLVSSQFTSRALRGLMSDRIIQVVTGSLMGIFAFCLFVLLTIRDPADGDAFLFVPSLSISVALVLAFFVLILLFIFVGHTVHSIQVSHLAGRIANQTFASLKHPYPGWKERTPMIDEDALAERENVLRSWSEEEAPFRIYASGAGYVQTISLYYLAKMMRQERLRVSLLVCPGDFVTRQTVIAEVWPALAVDAATIEAIQLCVSISGERDVDQDPAYGVRQLADIALRALSPAINDPTTGVLCIGYLRAIFESLCHDHLSSAVKHLDAESVLIVRYRTLQEYLKVLIEIGRYATPNARVVIVLLEAVAHIAQATPPRERHSQLALLAPMIDAIVAPAIKEARTDFDRTILIEHQQRAQQVIESLHSSQEPDAQEPDPQGAIQFKYHESFDQ